MKTTRWVRDALHRNAVVHCDEKIAELEEELAYWREERRRRVGKR